MIDSQTCSITTCNLTRVQSVTPQDINENRKRNPEGQYQKSMVLRKSLNI